MLYQPNIHTAIMTIDDAAEYTMLSDDIDTVVWYSTPISKEDILAKLAELQAEYDAQEYARNRKAEYDMLNQYEMMFDDQRDGTTTWVDAINAIKTKYPKS
jgi:hypothetical protein